MRLLLKWSVFFVPILYLLIETASTELVLADDAQMHEHSVSSIKEAVTVDPVEVSTGFSIASLSSQTQTFLRPSGVFGVILLPTWWLSPYADFRVGNMQLGFEGQLAENMHLSSEFEKNGFATGTFGSMVTLVRRGRWWLNLYGEYEMTIGGARAEVNDLTLRLGDQKLSMKDKLDPDDEFAIDWRRWEIGATVHTRMRRSERVWGFFSVALDGHSTSVDVSLSDKSKGLLGILGKTTADVEKLNGHSDIRPAFLPGIEVECAPWLRWSIEAIVVPLLHNDGFAYGGNTRFIVRPF